MSDRISRIFPEQAAPFFPKGTERVRTLSLTLFQLAALLSTIYIFRFETENHIEKILPLIFGGFIIHEALPLRFRLPFFLLLGIVSIFITAGYQTACITLLCGLTFIGISHIRITYLLKKIIAMLIAVFLALVYTRVIHLPLLHSSIPFLAAMFMFRWMIYLYEIRFEKTPSTLWQRLSYFFMLPNVCFPLFPIVDYKNFTRNYYNIPYALLHHNAIKKIFRGVIHLTLYRFIYYYLVPSPASISDLSGLLQYMVFSYLLILRLSGMFHLALGIIGLFGFDLPEIFNNYLLASGFSDLWRRINIYWREFVIKIFYQPIFFKLKKRMPATAMPLTLLIVFGINWFLHNYQWFWLRGTLSLKMNDIAFWAIFGITVMLNSSYQSKQQTNNNSEAPRSALKSSFYHILRIYGIFAFMCVLWSLWCSASFGEWLYLLSFAGTLSKGELIRYSLFIFLAILLGIGIDLALQRPGPSKFFRKIIEPGSRLILVYSLVLFIVSTSFTLQYLPGPVRDLITRLKENKLNTPDKVNMERGYYQKILSDEGKMSREIARSKDGKKKEWSETNKATVKTHDLLLVELLPNTRVEFKGAFISTNSWGMRDKEYTKEKAPGTFRIALTGGSYEMGSGIEDGKNYESVLEDKLNAGFAGQQHKKFEILDFGVGGYHVFQSTKVFEEKALPFSPDAILFVAHSDEYFRASRKLAELIKQKIDLQYPFLKEVVLLSGSKATMCNLEIEHRLKPFMPVIIKWIYGHVGSICRQKHIKPLWLFLPVIDDPMDGLELQMIKKASKEAGFLTFTLEDVYKNHNLDSLKLSPWDNHPNIEGHKLIADQLYELLLKTKKETGL